jgi:hypothetical protein
VELPVADARGPRSAQWICVLLLFVAIRSSKQKADLQPYASLE